MHIAGRGYVVLAFLLWAASAVPQVPANDPHKIDVVVIDAGHGGKDPGNLGTGRFKTTEKHVALSVAKRLGKYINESYPEVKVIYTREDDRFIELRERTEIANRNKADVFISIHCNANESKDPHGCETYVMGLHKTEANMKVAQKENAAILLEDGHELKYGGFDPKNPESLIALSLRQNAFLDHSLLLSSLIQKQFKERVGRTDRGVKQGPFLVICYTTMPAVLIELGFLTNATEEDFLQSEKGQDYMASAIYRAFKEYKGMMDGTSSQVVSTETARRDCTTVATKPTAKDSGVRFKVQVATSSKRIELQPRNFKGLEGVEEHRGAGLYRYTVGDEPTLDKARELQRHCRDKGFDGAFITAFKDGARIDLEEALKLARAQD
ncbi:MAG: N-acetylmuramoyl-L-alanine amidase [Flavobacteriales bacterium]|nr:N-acetylmuramoyl-L-alanine amidase [Flavobacteriales bacterium]